MRLRRKGDFGPDEQVEVAFDLVSTAGAQALGITDYGIAIGGAANLFTIAASYVAEAVAAIAAGMPITGHPPHRTGRAALSGSAAIAGFCPHRTHRAALPQWALQEGPETD